MNITGVNSDSSPRPVANRNTSTSMFGINANPDANSNIGPNGNLNNDGSNFVRSSARSSIPIRFHIPPSPPLNATMYSSHQMPRHAPAVPNLSIGTVPGSPVPTMTSDVGQDLAFASSSSPYIRATTSAIDNALSNERDRISKLEQHEAHFETIEEFKVALRKERHHSKQLVMELAELKSIAVASTLEAEVHEEGRINCLMRRVDGLKKEKGRIIVELEREEEMLTNTLQKKLNLVRKEKENLEEQIEREHMENARLRATVTNGPGGSGTIIEEMDDAHSLSSRAMSTDTTNTSNTAFDF